MFFWTSLLGTALGLTQLVLITGHVETSITKPYILTTLDRCFNP